MSRDVEMGCSEVVRSRDGDGHDQQPHPLDYGSTMWLGIDVGGTSIKGAIVDLEVGRLTRRALVEPTPPTANPDDVAAATRRIAAAMQWTGPVGIALPGMISGSSLRHAPNLCASWEKTEALTWLRAPNGGNAVLINDADAVGLAELVYGEASLDESGLTIVLTFGTGIGSALLHNGNLIADSELGSLSGVDGCFEEVASGRAISTEALTPVEWARRAQPFFDELQAILNPSRWVVGGGLSDDFEKFSSKLELSKPISVARNGMHAGIVGAAVAARGTSQGTGDLKRRLAISGGPRAVAAGGASEGTGDPAAP